MILIAPNRDHQTRDAYRSIDQSPSRSTYPHKNIIYAYSIRTEVFAQFVNRRVLLVATRITIHDATDQETQQQKRHTLWPNI